MLTWIQNLINPQSTSQAAQALQRVTTTTVSQPSKPTPADSIGTSSVDGQVQTLPRRSAKLIMVTTDNNNKFYDMTENGDGTFTVLYGRVGNRATEVKYHMTEWDAKIKEKIRKGYSDQTHLFAFGSTEPETQLDTISCKIVRVLIEDLMRYSRQSISHNYVVTADKVTRQQVNQAQTILDDLVSLVKNNMDLPHFNARLIELYQIIPRRMNNVREHLIKDGTELKAIEEKLAEEQATLDVMRGQVEINEQQKAQSTEALQPIDILAAMGLAIEVVKDEKTEKLIKNMMGEDSGKFRRAFRVTNRRTELSFTDFVQKATNQKTTLFWHGSRNENWLSILKSGLVLRPANAVITGKMFGYGLYFADKFKKSLNYSSLLGSFWARGSANKAYLALYEVHTGNQLIIQKHDVWCGNLTEERLKAKGAQYDSVFAKGGADLINNEYIVYNEAQCTVKYLVEIS